MAEKNAGCKLKGKRLGGKGMNGRTLKRWAKMQQRRKERGDT